jgi:hypothetical protein
MGRHRRDEHRFGLEMHTALPQNLVRALDVRDFEIQNRTRMIEVRSLRNCQYQANADAVEERHLRRHGEKVLHA